MGDVGAAGNGAGGSARGVALDVLCRVLEKGAQSHVELRTALERHWDMGKPDRAFTSRLVRGTLETLPQSDFLLGKHSSVAVPGMKPLIRTLLRMSVYQLLYMDGIPHRAVCDEAVKLARRQGFGGLTGFVNGVLRSISRELESVCALARPAKSVGMGDSDGTVGCTGMGDSDGTGDCDETGAHTATMHVDDTGRRADAGRTDGGGRGEQDSQDRRAAQKLRPADIYSWPDDPTRLCLPQWLLDLWRGEYGEEAAGRMAGSIMEPRALTARVLGGGPGVDAVIASLARQGVTAARHTWRRQAPDVTAEADTSFRQTAGPGQIESHISSDGRPDAKRNQGVTSVTDNAFPWPMELLILHGADSVDGLEAFQKGWIFPQDAASCLLGVYAPPRAGDFVLDICAAPGGKTILYGDLLGGGAKAPRDQADRRPPGRMPDWSGGGAKVPRDQADGRPPGRMPDWSGGGAKAPRGQADPDVPGGGGRVLARDKSPQKVELIRQNLRRTGMANVEVQVHDALTPDETLVGKCDLVVADLPCSGLGTLGRKPEIRYRMTPQMIGELSQLQRKMLAVAQAYVKPGGRLVFSTCTVSPTENRENAAWFLETYTGFSPGLIHGVGFDIPGAIMGDGTIQLLPGVCPCDGFFIGVFRRDG